MLNKLLFTGPPPLGELLDKCKESFECVLFKGNAKIASPKAETVPEFI